MSRKYDECFKRFREKLLSTPDYNSRVHALVLFGASGDLSKKEIYPNLYWMYRDGLMPAKFFILGFARSNLDLEQHLTNEKMEKRMQIKTDDEEQTLNDFLNFNFFMKGNYNDEKCFVELNQKLLQISEQLFESSECDRIFYLAVPPSVYPDVAKNVAKFCQPADSSYSSRLIIEKPFGRDLQSSNKLAEQLSQLFTESQIYRMDHFLGKELVQSLLTLRFSNDVFKEVWCNKCIESVLIDLRESFGAEGRGGYFDSYGIIRDVIQNHLLQILTLLAMEEPDSLNSSGDQVRDEKVRVLKSIPEVRMENVVLGQYVKSEQMPGYRDDKTVSSKSLTPTFATLVLFVENERWRGVPFVMRAGKALDQDRTEVRIQFKQDGKRATFGDKCSRNELVLSFKPVEGIYLKINTKRPGMDFNVVNTTLDLCYNQKYENRFLPGAYERLLIDIILGKQLNFVRSDELSEAWRIFTPLLHKIEQENVQPIEYEYGSHSIPEADELCDRVGKISFCDYKSQDTCENEKKLIF